MITICGPSGAGKNYLADQLRSKGFKIVPVYSTREGRIGERDTIQLTVDEYEQAKKEDRFVLLSEFNGWKYGVLADDLLVNTNDVLVVSPIWLRYLKETYSKNIYSIMVDAPDDVRERRLRERGDDPKEIARRIIADRYDFEALIKDNYERGVESRLIDHFVWNNDFGDEHISKIVDLIVEEVAVAGH